MVARRAWMGGVAGGFGSPRILRVLGTPWGRALAVLWLAQVLAEVAFSFALPFIPLYLLDLGVADVTEAGLWAGAMAGGFAVLMAVTAPLWGVIADRYGRRLMVQRATFGAAVIIGAMGFVRSPMQLLILRVLQGSVTGVVAATTTLVSLLVPARHVGAALGLMTAAQFAGGSLGPLTGGFVADRFGYRAAFLATSAIFVLAGALVTLFVAEPERSPVAAVARRASGAPEAVASGDAAAMARGGPAGSAAGEGTPAAGPRRPIALPDPDLPDVPAAPAVPGAASGAGLWRREVLAVVALAAVIRFANLAPQPVLPLFVQQLGEDPARVATTVGLVLSATGLAGMVSALAIGRVSDRYGRGPTLLACLVAATILSPLHALASSVWQLVALRTALGLALGGMAPAVQALLAELTPPARRGAAFGLLATAGAIGNGAGPVLGSAVAAAFGIPAVFVVSAPLFLAGAALLWRLQPLRQA